jgi:hypothetical protein
MLRIRGFRYSLVGAVIFLVSIASLAILPDLLPVLGMLAGGTLVFGGFVMTIFHYYQSSP